MTNRDLLNKALPLTSLSEKEWNEITELQNKVTGVLLSALETLITNQARIEVLANYKDYYGDRLDETVPEESISGI